MVDRPRCGTIKYKFENGGLGYEFFHFCDDGLLVFGKFWSTCGNCKRLENLR